MFIVLTFVFFAFALRPLGVEAANSSCTNASCSPQCCSSFLSGTKIVINKLGDEVEVQDLKVDDFVLSFDEKSGNTRTNKVVGLKIGEREGFYTVKIGGKELHATSNHPFYVGRLYKSWDKNVPEGYKRTDELILGENVFVLSFDGKKIVPAKVENLRYIPGRVSVYTLSVAGDQNYFAERVAVHNKFCYTCPTPTPAPTPTPTSPPPPPPSCPNGFCGSGETCSSCSQDCGDCVTPPPPTPTPTPEPPGFTPKGRLAMSIFEDKNQNGVWDYNSGEARIDPIGCGGTNTIQINGFSLAWTGNASGWNCNLGNSEYNTADICSSPFDCPATSCNGWGEEFETIRASAVNGGGSCHIECSADGNCRDSTKTSMSGALCRVNGAYCASGGNANFQVGPFFYGIGPGNETATLTLPTGWQMATGLNVKTGIIDNVSGVPWPYQERLLEFGVVRTPLAAPTNLTTTCSGTGDQVTIGWDDVAGAVDYIIRVDRNDGLIPEWYNPPPAGGDQIFYASAACSSSGGRSTCVVNVTAGATYTNWTVQPIASGESYPYGSPAASGGTFTCTVPGTLTGTFFDASELSSCPADPQTLSASLKISGGVLAANGVQSYGVLTGSNGLYTISGMATPDTYSLLVDPGSSYVETPKFACQGSTATYLAAGGTLTRDFGFWKTYGGWFQALGGGVYGGSGITSNIPGSMPAADRYLIDTDADGQDGLAYYKSGSISLGTYPGLTVSVSGWNANSGYSGDRQDYAYWLAKMGIYTKTNWVGTGKPAYNPGTNGYEIYTYTGTATINFSPSANEKVIYLINGDVNVTGNITVPKTAGSPSFLAVIASGTITFANNVSSAQGLWVGNSISVASTGNTATEVQFAGEGSFVGWSSVTLLRDRGTTNNTAPAEKFTFRPDLIINAPAPMKLADTVFRLETP